MAHNGYSVPGLLYCFAFFLQLLQIGNGDVSYSIPEEMRPGSVVGNIARDLGLNVGKFSARKARIDTELNRKRYCDINLNTGDLIVAERIDREALCGEKASCILKFELILEAPLELHRISLQIHDINDNPPVFAKDEIKIEINELAVKGSRFRVLEAHDADIGQNAVQSYALQTNSYLELKTQSKLDGGKYAELVLEKELDREEQQELRLLLTALDGGNPKRTGTATVYVTVLDANDNAPVFSQAVYDAIIPENAPLDTVVVKVAATDADEGLNGEVTYELSRISETAKRVFALNHTTGEIKVIGPLDFEEESVYEMRVDAKDGYGLTSDSKVIIKLSDVNDNPPGISLKSLNNPIPENVSPGTEVGIINVQDRDSEKNGQVRCFIQQGVPFKLVPSIKNYYSLVSTGQLDREVVSDYNITISATDEGSPPLSSSKSVQLSVDVNDNPPVFPKDAVKLEIRESAVKGARYRVNEAHDADIGQNTVKEYSLQKNGHFVLSVHDDADGSKTVELTKEEINLLLTAVDGGSPQRSGTVMIDVTVLDANDNAPVFSQSIYKASVPENSPVNTVVVTVSATDADDGVNGEVTYDFGHVSETDGKVFSIDSQTGEIRIIGSTDFEKKNTFELDNGQPSLSATCSMYLLISDNLAEVPELKEMSNYENNSKLTSYLIIALVSVSTFFLTFIIIILGVRFCRRRKPRLLFDGAVAIPSAYLPPNYADVDGTGTLRSTYNYDAYLTTGSRTSDFKFVTSYNDNTLPADQTLRKSPTDFLEAFGDSDDSSQVRK
uniref:Cadherin domain-containing protein n=1 Tax=Stegastes partitus TaxID=144197 RepID=A0A3B4ZA81_9TELE